MPHINCVVIHPQREVRARAAGVLRDTFDDCVTVLSYASLEESLNRLQARGEDIRLQLILCTWRGGLYGADDQALSTFYSFWDKTNWHIAFLVTNARQKEVLETMLIRDGDPRPVIDISDPNWLLQVRSLGVQAMTKPFEEERAKS